MPIGEGYLFDMSDISHISDRMVCNQYGYLTTVYHVRGANLEHYSVDEQAQYGHQIELFLNALKPEFECQIIVTTSWDDDVTLPHTIQQSEDKVLDVIWADQQKAVSASRDKHIYLAISYAPAMKTGVFGKKQRMVSEAESRQQLADMEGQWLRVLQQSGLKMTQLTTTELYRLVFRLANPKKYRVATPDIDETDEITLGALCHSAIEHQKQVLHVDNGVVKSLVIETLPTHADPLFLSQLDFEFNTVVSIRFRKEDADTHITKLGIKKNILSSSSGVIADLLGIKTSGVDETKSRQAIDEITDTIETVSRSEQELLEYSFTMLVFGDDEPDVTRKALEVQAQLQAVYKLQMIDDDYNHLDNFLSCIPSQCYLNKYTQLVLTKPLTWLLPFNDFFKGTKTAELVLQGHKNQKIPISFKDNALPSSHFIMVAPTGMGKSFTMNYMLQQWLNDEDTYLSVIDKGGSYKKLGLLYDADYLELDLNERYAINIFCSKETFFNERDINRDKLVFLRQFLMVAISDDQDRSLSVSEEQLMDHSIVEFYQSLEAKHTPLLSEYVTYLDYITCDKDDRVFIQKLKKGLLFYCAETSAYSVLLNRQSQLEFGSRFVIFDTTRFKDHPRLEKLYFFLINHSIQEKMKILVKEGKQQIVIFEEAWSVLKTKASVELIETLYRESRKYGTKIGCISQSAKDFVEHEQVNIIADNSEIKFVLAHGVDNMAGLDKLGLHETDLAIISSMQAKQDVFLKFGSDRCVFKVVVSALQEELFSTDAESLRRYQQCRTRDELLDVLVKRSTEIMTSRERMYA